MRRFKLKKFLFMFCVVILATAGQAAHAGLMTTFTATTSTDTSGMTTYGYTLTNEVGSDLPVVDLILNVDPTANLQNITGPTGWTIYYSAGDPVAEWSSPSSATDLLQGSTAYLSFQSMLPPGPQYYLITGLSDSPPFVDTSSGYIDSPTAISVPEPRSLLLMLWSVGALVLMASRMR